MHQEQRANTVRKLLASAYSNLSIIEELEPMIGLKLIKSKTLMGHVIQELGPIQHRMDGLFRETKK